MEDTYLKLSDSFGTLIDRKLDREKKEDIGQIPINKFIYDLLITDHIGLKGLKQTGDNNFTVANTDTKELYWQGNSSFMLPMSYYFRVGHDYEDAMQHIQVANVLIQGLLETLGVTVNAEVVTLDTEEIKQFSNRIKVMDRTMTLINTILSHTECHANGISRQETLRNNLINTFGVTEDTIAVTQDTNKLGDSLVSVYWLSLGDTVRTVSKKTGLSRRLVADRRDQYCQATAYK